MLKLRLPLLTAQTKVNRGTPEERRSALPVVESLQMSLDDLQQRRSAAHARWLAAHRQPTTTLERRGVKRRETRDADESELPPAQRRRLS